MKKIIYVLIILFAFQIGNAQTDVEFFNKGIEYYSLGKYNFALTYFTKSIDLNNQDASYFYNRGCCNFQLNSYYDAINDFVNAVKLNDNYLNKLNDKLKNDVNKKLQEEVEQNLDKQKRNHERSILENKKRDLESKRANNKFYIRAKEIWSRKGDSFETFEECLSIYPEYIEIYIARIKLYEKDNNCREILNQSSTCNHSLKDYKMILELDPDNLFEFKAMYNNALNHEKRKEWHPISPVSTSTSNES